MRTIITCILLAVIIQSCITEDKNYAINQLFKELCVNDEMINAASYLIVIPQTACNSCIEQIRKIMNKSKDTIYIINSQSPKDFYLLTGKKLDEIPNAYIDKSGAIQKLKAAHMLPTVFRLKNKKVLTSYLLNEKGFETKDQPETNIKISPNPLELGEISCNEPHRHTIIITNIGSKTLRVRKIEKSCDCLELSYHKREVLPNDTLHLNIVFKPDTIGEFLREVYLYGNIKESPKVIVIEGTTL